MGLEKLITDVEQTARQLAQDLEAHRNAYTQHLSRPDPRPMFNTTTDGAVLDRRGLTVRAAPKKE